MVVLILFKRTNIHTTYFAYAFVAYEWQRMRMPLVYKKLKKLRSVRLRLTRSYDLNGTFLSLCLDPLPNPLLKKEREHSLLNIWCYQIYNESSFSQWEKAGDEGS